MPELPEVEAARKAAENEFLGQTVTGVWSSDDRIVLKKATTESFAKALVGRKLESLGRKGKYWWLAFDGGQSLIIHFGMSGRSTAAEPPASEAPYAKLRLDFSNGKSLVLSDGRRLGRIWLSDDVARDPAISKLGDDVLDSPPDGRRIRSIMEGKKAPLKAILLDQSLFAGVGNYLADEILYRAKLDPRRPGSSLSQAECKRLATALTTVVAEATELVGRDVDFPEDWLFNVRWGRERSIRKTIGGKAVVREPIGGRTTAWVPAVQK